MVYTYNTSYYYSFHDTLASLCKSLLLPFSSHKSRHRQLPSDDQINNKFAKRQTDNLKWQQESFHRILNLIGLHKEGLVSEGEVSAFRTHLLDTLVASPKEPEPAGLTRDRLLFLQELLYAECISADQYHSSEKPLLQRLAVVEIESTPVTRQEEEEEQEQEDRSVIELGERESPLPVQKTKQQTPAKSLFKWKGKAKGPSTTDANNGGSILMPESSPGVNKSEKRKPFRTLFINDKSESSAQKPTKKHWRLDGLKKWRRGDAVKEDESTAPYLLTRDRSEDASTVVPCDPVANPMDQGRKNVRCGGLAEGESMKEEEEELNDELKDQSSAYNGDSGGWVAFEENEENRHPNLFFRDQSVSTNQGLDEANCKMQSKDARDCFLNNPFVDDQNPLWATKS